MIADKNTNFVYFSKWSESDFGKEIEQLKKIFEKHNIKSGIINNTRDYYCRDYMPVQVSKDRFIQFIFNPCYLKPSELTSTDNVFKKNKFLQDLNIICSAIKLDGGNVVKGDSRVIITDRVVDDNQGKDKNRLVKELNELLETEVIIVPAYPRAKEPTGHADGMVRFVNDQQVITYNFKNQPPEWLTKFKKALKEKNIEIIEMPLINEEQKNWWGYINYLMVGKLIVLPVFGYAEDEKVEEFFTKHFRGYSIATLDCNNLIKKEGVLNCFTWSIQK